LSLEGQDVVCPVAREVSEVARVSRDLFFLLLYQGLLLLGVLDAIYDAREGSEAVHCCAVVGLDEVLIRVKHDFCFAI